MLRTVFMEVRCFFSIGRPTPGGNGPASPFSSRRTRAFRSAVRGAHNARSSCVRGVARPRASRVPIVDFGFDPAHGARSEPDRLGEAALGHRLVDGRAFHTDAVLHLAT